MVIAVIGHEGSGTQWLTWALLLHPDVDRTVHVSYPVSWRGSPYRPLRECVPPETPVLVMMRDATCSARSNEHRGFFLVDPSRRNRLRASDEMWRDLYAAKGRVVFASYEGLIEENERYMSVILQQLGLDPGRFDWDEWWSKHAPSDGNAKYIS